MQSLLNGDVIVEIIKFVGLIATPILGYVTAKKVKENKSIKADNELLKDNVYQTKVRVLKELFDLQHFAQLERYINLVWDTTPMDRFTIMFVMNGKINFNYLTVIHDQSSIDHKLGGASPYAKFSIDQSYKNLVHKIEKGRPVWYDIPAKEIGEMNDFIELEGIKKIVFFLVKRIPIDEFNDIVVYLSFSSTTEHDFDKLDTRRVELITSGKITPKLEDLLELPTVKNADELLSNLETTDESFSNRIK